MSLNSSMTGLLVTYPYVYQILATVTTFFGCMLLFGRLKRHNPNLNGLPLPPGPKGLPLIGNLFDFPINHQWLVYSEWQKTYGDMVYFNVLGQHFLVLGSLQRTTDLFEKRSLNYSDRMRLPMLVELMKWDFAFPFLPYGAAWKKYRRTFQEFFHHNEVFKYQSIQKREVHTFLRRVLVTPDNFLHHIRHLFGATFMKISYGIDVQESDDPHILLTEQSLSGVNEASVPGAFWVDFFPILKFVPSWFPGAGFQKKAAHWRQNNASMIQRPFDYVKDQLTNGTAVSSMTATLIERFPHEGDPRRPVEEKHAKDVAATAYIGGTDTTFSAVQTLFLAMALYPEVQKKAQAEIDAVVGPDRLPEFEDRPSLPYIDAVVKESMRWNLVTPLAFPHMATNDDEYDGYYIPKGTIVFGNGWSILHDPKYFNNPMEYQPERYLKDGKLNPDVMDPASVAFGYGRRICPGRHLADSLLYLIASCLLAVYDIKPPVGGLKPEFSSGVVSSPVPFNCFITPRTSAAEALIRDSIEDD